MRSKLPPKDPHPSDKSRHSSAEGSKEGRSSEVFKSLTTLLSQTQARLLAGLVTRPLPSAAEVQSVVMGAMQTMSEGVWTVFFRGSGRPGEVKELVKRVEDLEQETRTWKSKYEEAVSKSKESFPTTLETSLDGNRRNRTVGRKRPAETTTRVPSLNSSISSSDLKHLRHSSSLLPRHFHPLRQVLKAPRSISPANLTINSLRSDLQRCKTMLEATQQERDLLKSWKEAKIRKGEDFKADEGEKRRLEAKIAIFQHRLKSITLATQRLVRLATSMKKSVRDKDLVLHFETARTELEVLFREFLPEHKANLTFSHPINTSFEAISGLEKENMRLNQEIHTLNAKIQEITRENEGFKGISKAKTSGLNTVSQLEDLFASFSSSIWSEMSRISSSLASHDQSLTRLSLSVRNRLQDQLKSLILVNDLFTSKDNTERLREEKEELQRMLQETQLWSSQKIKELEGLLEQTYEMTSVRVDSKALQTKNDHITELERQISLLSHEKDTLRSQLSLLEASLHDKEAEITEFQYEICRLEEKEREIMDSERKKAEEFVTTQSNFQREMREAVRKIEELEAKLVEKSNKPQKSLLDRPNFTSEKPVSSFLDQLNPPKPSKNYGLMENTSKIEKLEAENRQFAARIADLEDSISGQRRIFELEKDQLVTRYEEKEGKIVDLTEKIEEMQEEIERIKREKREISDAFEGLKRLIGKEEGKGTEESPKVRGSEDRPSLSREIKTESEWESPYEAVTPRSVPSSSPRVWSLAVIRSVLKPYMHAQDDLTSTITRLVHEFEQLRRRKVGVVIPKLQLKSGVMSRECQTTLSAKSDSDDSAHREISVQSTEQETPRHKQVTSGVLYSLHRRMQSLETELYEAAKAREMAEAEVRRVRVGEMKEIVLRVIAMLPKQ